MKFYEIQDEQGRFSRLQAEICAESGQYVSHGCSYLLAREMMRFHPEEKIGLERRVEDEYKDHRQEDD